MSRSDEMKTSHKLKRAKSTTEATDLQMLNYIKEQDLIRCVGADHYKHLKESLAKKLQSKVTLRQVKHEIGASAFYQNLLRQIRASPIGVEAVNKYLEARARAKRIDKSKCSIIKAAMTQARTRFLGCLATKIPSQLFDEILESYDDAKYDNIKIIPNTLRHRVYENTTDEKLKECMEPSIKTLNLSNNLPPGLKAYMRKYPREFLQQTRELQTQRKLANTILRSMKSEQLARLQAYIEEHKHFDPKDFTVIVGR